MPLKMIENNKSVSSSLIEQNNNNNSFKDLEEIKSPVRINFNIKRKASNEKIVFTARDPFIEKLFEKLENDQKKLKKSGRAYKEVEKKSVDIPSLGKNKIGLLARAKKFIKEIKKDSTEEAIVLSQKSEAETVEENFFDQNFNLEYPGDISLTTIDKNLSNPELKSIEKDAEEPDVLGVNRANVFYNIEKQIHSTRSTTIFSKLRLKNIKKGLFLPAMIALSSFIFLVIAGIILSLYFKSISTATLEDNIIKDESILAKIAKQKDEEARLAALKLEEERRKLEDEKNRLESTINEELLKREAEIENKYLEKMKSLELSGVSDNEIEKIKKEYDVQKEDELKKAREERDTKIVEQSKEITEKDEKLKQAVENLKKESESHENELVRIKEEFEQRRVEEEKKVEEANIQIRKLQETERTIKDFNQTVYQLILAAMADFKDNKLDSATGKLSEVLKYYNSRLDFVNSNIDLKNKMLTDIFFVETINSLIEESKNSVTNNREYMKIVNKFKKITESYQRAENLHTEGQFEKSGKEYEKVLEEFDEVNSSYQRLKDIEKRKQNEIASKYYDEALSNIENKQYQSAISNLTAIIKETPISDYTSQALNNLVTTAEVFSYTRKVSKDNGNAVVLYKKAELLKENKKYSDALKIYQDIITDYPFSDYTKNSLESIKNINTLLGSQNIETFNSSLNDKFISDYKKYKNYYDKGDIERARIYYFEALKNAFDIYANNSISQFKKVEDAYIEDLLRNNILRSEDYFNVVLNQQNDKLKKLKEEKDTLEKQLEYLNGISELSSKQKKEIISKYEDELKKKDEEINELRKYIESQKGLTSEGDSKLLEEYKAQLTAEREKSDALKKQLYEYYDKINELDEAKSLKKELDVLKKRYDDLEKKYNEKSMTVQEKEKIKEDLEKVIEEKYRLLKEKEVEEERLKIKNEYEKELAKIRGSISSNESSTKEGKYLGRITTVVNSSVTFEFIILNKYSKIDLKINDELQIIRLSGAGSNRKEIVIGKIVVSYISSDSLYGSGNVISVNQGMNIEKGDLLIKL